MRLRLSIRRLMIIQVLVAALLVATFKDGWIDFDNVTGIPRAGGFAFRGEGMHGLDSVALVPTGEGWILAYWITPEKLMASNKPGSTFQPIYEWKK